jgi:DNA-binding SARP family transcriptional activator/tetratricopeptide (TPR) repeat protein
MPRIRLLGELEVELDGEELRLPPGRRVRALLAWLALNPGLHPRSRLAARFWPDVLDSSARASLRSAIWALRSALGPEGGACLVADRDGVGLRDEGLWVDVREFDALLAAGRLREAVELCRGELLYELDDDWVFEAREQHEQRLAAALGALAAEAEARGEHVEAIGWARRRSALDPLDEDAARELIRLLAGSGDVPGALAAYGRLAERLRGELRIAPGAETRALVERLRERTPAPPALELDAAQPERPLIGRESELERLASAWRRARAGSGTAVLLTGEGGIGKTRLVEELLAGAAADGACSVACAGVELGGARPSEPGGAPPFGIWAELLRDLAAELGPLPQDAVWTSELARLLPGVGRQPGSPDSRAEPGLERLRLFEAVVELLGWAARERPLALAFEDLHLADVSSLELLAYAGRRILRQPVLLVLTRRPVPAPELEATIGSLHSRRALALELGMEPLAEQAVRRLARGAGELSDAAVEEIVGVAGGSPLLAVEAARAHARGDAPAAAGLRDAARAALSRLDEQGRLFVELAAVAGRELERADVASLPLLDDPRGAASAALGGGLLRAREGAIGFRHALLRSAVYDSIPEPARARLHEALADVLRRQAGRRSTRRAADVARHFRLAGRDELALAQLARAAAEAREVAALQEAADFLREAAEIDPGDPELLVELAEVEAWRGLLAESDRAFEQALERIPSGDAGGLVSAWLRRGRWLRGGICHPRESRRSYRAALDVLDREPAPDRLERAEALAGLAWAQAVAGDPEAVEALLREVGEITGREPVGDLLSHDIGVARGHALLRAARFRESYGPLVAAGAAAGRAGRPDMAYSCLINAASAAACAGEFERALDFADRCLALVVPNGLLRLGVYCQSARATVLRQLGRLDEAAAACDAAAALAERIGLEELEGLVRHDRGLLALAGGELERAAAELELALERGAPVSRPLARLQRAEALARAGRADEAEAELRSVALEPVSPSDFPDTLVARMSHVQGLIALARGRRELAERRLREAVAGWERRAGQGADLGEGYVSALVDLGRPPVSVLVEPGRELARVRAELEALAEEAASGMAG